MNLDNSDLDRNIESDYDSDCEVETTISSLALDNFEEKTIKIKNPFFSRDEIIVDNFISKILNLNQKEIVSNFNSLYIVCQKNNGVISDKFYEEEISIVDLESFINNLIIIEGNFKMLYNPVHKSACVVMNSSYLSLFKSNIQFEETELVLPLINLSEDNVRLYVKQYDGMFTIKDYITTKVVNDFYKNTSSLVTNFCVNIINSMEESSYWKKSFNTKLNITNKFINRGFNLTINQRIKDVNLKTILQEVNDIPREGDNYFGFLFKKQKYVDVSSSINKNGYTLYKITESSIKLGSGDIEYLIMNCQNNYELYKFLCNILISKDYCHLIINDKEKLKKLNNGFYYDRRYDAVNFLKRYNLAFKYAIGYSWLTFYTEESIKKTKITDDDRFVFSIDTATELPSFPLHYENIHQNPYLPILISREIIDIENNCVGVNATNNGDNMGIVNLNQFQKNLNIFLSDDCNINILKDINWDNIAISGSVIPACITKYNPLERLFSSKVRYFSEYYCNSDIDIMCNIQDPFKYIDKAYEFYNIISKNINIYYKLKNIEKKINIKAEKSVAIIVNESFIRKNIIKNNKEFTYDYVFTHFDDINVKKKFYKFYIKWKINENEKYMKSSYWKNEKYITFFDIVPVDDIIIIFARTKNDWDKYWLDTKTKNNEYTCPEEDLEELEKEHYNTCDVHTDEIDENIDDDNILFSCKENLKFKIVSKYLNHNFEFFKTKYEGSFFSTVSQFHLPCVRGFYNGKDVKLLPSCISAAMTLINIDYKYFAGSKDPIEIINKYRMRGYTTLLNDSERIRLVSYSNKVEKWNNLYGQISKNNSNSINNIFGPKNVNYSLFKPRQNNFELYKEIKPITLNYNNFEVEETSLEDESYGGLNIDKIRNLMNLTNGLTTIGIFGYVNVVKQWYFDAIYENF